MMSCKYYEYEKHKHYFIVKISFIIQTAETKIPPILVDCKFHKQYVNTSLRDEMMDLFN